MRVAIAAFCSLLGLSLTDCLASSAGSPVDPPTTPPLSAPEPVAPVASSEPAPADSAAVAPAPVASAPAPAVPAGKSIDELKAEAHKDLGPKVSFDLVRERYLVVAAPGWGAKGSADFIERVLKALFNERFARGPARPLPVYLFGDAASYNAYCKQRYGGECISIYGFFSPSDYRLVMNLGLGIGTLSHELVHPIVDADFPDAPTWINEGIASLYEAPIMPRDGEIHGAKNWRYPRLSSALHSPRERDKVSLPALFGMSSDERFRDDDESLHYAAARYFCQWMDAQGKLWPFYQAWRDSFASDPTGDKAFARVMGKTPAEASPTWITWASRL